MHPALFFSLVLSLSLVSHIAQAQDTGSTPTSDMRLAQVKKKKRVKPKHRHHIHPKSKRRQSKKRPKRAAKRRNKTPTSVPLDVSFGPAANFITGPVQDDQLVHTSLRFNIQAIISRELLLQNKNRVPRKYRGMLKNTQEIRYKPLALNLIPRELILSPKRDNTSIYGVGWNLFGVGLAPVAKPVRIGLNLGVILKYMYIDSTVLEDTHFFRPGLEAALSFEVPVSSSFLFSFGWASQLYIPQKLGAFSTIGDLDESIWHIGQAYFKLHFRVPYTL